MAWILIACHPRRLDPDKSGFIDAHELGNLLKGSVEQSDIDQMIADADAEGEHDGKISREEFIKIVSRDDFITDLDAETEQQKTPLP